MNIGRRTALQVGLIGAAVGLYNIISGKDTGQVWERTTDGSAVRRAELEAASHANIAQLVVTPEAYGAVGDGVADDSLALSNACKALTARGRGQLLLSQRYRIARGNPGNHIVGALELLGQSAQDRYEVVFVGGAKLLMDNLNAQGNGDQLGAIFFRGPMAYIAFRNPEWDWVTQPKTRSQGDGIMGRGYPGDDGPTIGRCIIDHPRGSNAPQASIILMGISDPHIIGAQVGDGRADGVHINACRRPIVIGGIKATNIGDDALAFVTYYGKTGDPVNGPDDPRSPFFVQGLSEWSNGGGYADKVEVLGGHANACRINGALNLTVDTVIGQQTPYGLQLDATIANGNSLVWTAAASRGCRVGRVVTDGAYRAVLALAQNVDRGAMNATDFLKWDMEIGQVIARNGIDNVDVLVSDLDGIRFGVLDIDREVRVTGAASNTTLADVTTKTRLNVDMATGTTVGRLRASNAVLRNADVYGDRWVLSDAPGTALAAEGNVSGRIARLEINRPNRSRDAGAYAVRLNRGVDLKLPDVQLRNDDKPLSGWFEIGGGGDAESRSRNITLNMDVVHTGDNSNERITLQAGPYAPYNLDYRLRCSVDGGKTWTTTVRQDSVTRPVAYLNAYLYDPYTTTGNATIPFNTVTHAIEMGNNGETGTITVRYNGQYDVAVDYFVMLNAGDNYNAYLQVNGNDEVTKFGRGSDVVAGMYPIQGTRTVQLNVGDTIKLVADLPRGRTVLAGGGINVTLRS